MDYAEGVLGFEIIKEHSPFRHIYFGKGKSIDIEKTGKSMSKQGVPELLSLQVAETEPFLVLADLLDLPYKMKVVHLPLFDRGGTLAAFRPLRKQAEETVFLYSNEKETKEEKTKGFTDWKREIQAEYGSKMQNDYEDVDCAVPYLLSGNFHKQNDASSLKLLLLDSGVDPSYQVEAAHFPVGVLAAITLCKNKKKEEEKESRREYAVEVTPFPNNKLGVDLDWQMKTSKQHKNGVAKGRSEAYLKLKY